jgi:hypothetical protein
MTPEAVARDVVASLSLCRLPRTETPRCSTHRAPPACLASPPRRCPSCSDALEVSAVPRYHALVDDASSRCL